MATILALAAPTTFAIDKRSGNPVGIPPGTVADYLRPVIMAHRHFSTIHIPHCQPTSPRAFKRHLSE